MADTTQDQPAGQGGSQMPVDKARATLPGGPDGPPPAWRPPIFPALLPHDVPAGGPVGAGGDFGAPLDDDVEFVIEDPCPCPEPAAPVYIPWPVPFPAPEMPAGVAPPIATTVAPPPPGPPQAPPPIINVPPCPPAQVVLVGAGAGGVPSTPVDVNVASPTTDVSVAAPSVTVEAPPPVVVPAPQVTVYLTVPGEGAPVVNVGPITATATAQGGLGGAGGSAVASATGGEAFAQGGLGGAGGTAIASAAGGEGFGGPSLSDAFGTVDTVPGGPTDETPAESDTAETPIIAAPVGKKVAGPVVVRQALRWLGIPIPNWSDPQACNPLTDVQVEIRHLIEKNLPDWLRKALLDPKPNYEELAKAPTDSLPWPFKRIAAWALARLLEAMRFLLDVAGGAAGGCKPIDILIPCLVTWLLGVVERWTGIPAGVGGKAFTYWRDWACPHHIPSIAEADSAYLAHAINESQWECWVRANDKHFAPHKVTTQAKRSKPGLHEWLEHYRRLPDSAVGLDDRIRQLGWLDAVERDTVKGLQWHWPGADLTLRLIASGSCDLATSVRYGYDDGFDPDELGQCGYWLRAAGWQGEEARALWRGRWHLPNFHEAFLASIRLAPGSAPAGLEVTDEDVEQCAIAHGVPPFWRKRLMHLMRKPLSLREVRTGYIKGVFSVQEATKHLRLMAFTEEAVDAKFQAWNKDRVDAVAREWYGKAYLAGTMNEEELLRALADDGYREPLTSEVAKLLGDRAVLQRRAGIIKCYKSRYQKGEWSYSELVAVLINGGVDSERAVSLADEWSCLRSARGKEAGAAALCKWAQDGLITPEVYYARLLALGYDARDATLMARACAMAGERAPKAPAKDAKLPAPPKLPKPPAKKQPTKDKTPVKQPAKKQPLRGAAAAAAARRAEKVQKAKERLWALYEKLAVASAKVTGNSAGEDLTGVVREVGAAAQRYEISELGAAALLGAAIAATAKVKGNDWRADWAAALTVLPERAADSAPGVGTAEAPAPEQPAQ